MKPFLLLATRAEDFAADAEYRSFLRYGGLAEGELRRIRLESGPMPELELADYSGIFLGGSPFNSSDPEESKSDVQVRVEHELGGLLDRVVPEDFPFFGACYGVGTLGRHQGAVVDTTYAEPIGAVEVTLTDDGAVDPLLAGLPPSFAAYVGHKEACAALPPSAVLLASSATCPVQMFRVGQNVYATQFHPELDVEALVGRISTYRHAGYFPPEQADEYMARARATTVDQPEAILRAFVARYARS
ncbi:glutamine amidotransferase [Arthrobacter agilis]|uniref:glutamine amidotransferase n=1 Tax=Arthrobacter agilis TaxID=37921 RepID=UPI000B35C612|nr:glutamine amidotransferase [Arthrobacter agilis]OUM40654.1 glutamine amidotransferase [Arthrobacter agilis]PPB45264.1 glutamine amidotransferase [Arthrobacter agilis]TPV27970.1 glutamine amidotransferase [Arthrobacter agilis]VDR31341.1 GMP synthase [glutamine-hydrolyzing] [Arthrobacter agilis]